MKKIKEIKYYELYNRIEVFYEDNVYRYSIILDYEVFKNYTLCELEYYINKECLIWEIIGNKEREEK